MKKFRCKFCVLIFFQMYDFFNPIVLVISPRMKRNYNTKSYTIKVSIERWMTCDFTSFSTVFQSNQDDRQMMMKGLCNETSLTFEKISPRAGLDQ